jgi:hypothetical protein
MRHARIGIQRAIRGEKRMLLNALELLPLLNRAASALGAPVSARAESCAEAKEAIGNRASRSREIPVVARGIRSAVQQ